MSPCGHKYGLSAELPSPKHPTWRPTKVSPCWSLPVLPLAPGVTTKCHSQMSTDISGGGWHKNSAGALRTYSTVLEAKQGARSPAKPQKCEPSSTGTNTGLGEPRPNQPESNSRESLPEEFKLFTEMK